MDGRVLSVARIFLAPPPVQVPVKGVKEGGWRDEVRGGRVGYRGPSEGVDSYVPLEAAVPWNPDEMELVGLGQLKEEGRELRQPRVRLPRDAGGMFECTPYSSGVGEDPDGGAGGDGVSDGQETVRDRCGLGSGGAANRGHIVGLIVKGMPLK